jgi:hypothetical protein
MRKQTFLPLKHYSSSLILFFINSYHTNFHSNILRGKMSCLAPECFATGGITEKFDAFNFGMFLLQVLTRRAKINGFIVKLVMCFISYEIVSMILSTINKWLRLYILQFREKRYRGATTASCCKTCS